MSKRKADLSLTERSVRARWCPLSALPRSLLVYIASFTKDPMGPLRFRGVNRQISAKVQQMNEKEVSLSPVPWAMRQMDDWHKNRVATVHLRSESYLSSDRRRLVGFPHLQSLHVTGYLIKKLHGKVIPRITSLTISHSTLNFSGVYENIACFPNVTELTLVDWAIVKHGFKKSFPSLRKLNLLTGERTTGMTIDMDLDVLSTNPNHFLTFVGSPHIKEIVFVSHDYQHAPDPSDRLVGSVTTDRLHDTGYYTNWDINLVKWCRAFSPNEMIVNMDWLGITDMLTERGWEEIQNPVRMILTKKPAFTRFLLEVSIARAEWANSHLTVEVANRPKTQMRMEMTKLESVPSDEEPTPCYECAIPAAILRYFA